MMFSQWVKAVLRLLRVALSFAHEIRFLFGRIFILNFNVHLKQLGANEYQFHRPAADR